MRILILAAAISFVAVGGAMAQTRPARVPAPPPATTQQQLPPQAPQATAPVDQSSSLGGTHDHASDYNTANGE